MSTRIGNVSHTILLRLPPVRWFVSHAYSIILKGQRERFINATLESSMKRMDIITGLRIDKSTKIKALKQSLSATLRQGPHAKGYKYEAVKHACLALIKLHAYEDAFLLAGESIRYPIFRDDIVLEVIDQMFYQGMNRDKVVDICKKVAGQVPGMHTIISGIYENYPIIN